MVNMSFESALTHIKSGGSAAREGWNGKGLSVELQVPDAKSKMSKPYLYLCYADNQKVPWAPSQTDVLANDWIIVK